MSFKKNKGLSSLFRLRKLDALILQSFLGPFAITFFLVLFVFTLQFYWVYMDELIGKGLGFGLTSKLLLLMSATLFPLALPLGILLASIMTFGNLAENYELVAIKSSGISLFRFMRPLIIFIGGVSVFAFWFNNSVIPVANLKSFSLLYDMRRQKPALDIRPGIFNKEFDDFVIRIGEKGKDGQTIRNILIYKENQGRNNNLITAKEGKMFSTKDNRWLVFELHDGWHYQEKEAPEGKEDLHEQTRMHFNTWYQQFDLSGFSFSRTSEALFKGNERMMNVEQLSRNIDSLKKVHQNTVREISSYFNPYFTVLHFKIKADSLLKQKLEKQLSAETIFWRTGFLEHIPDSARSRVASVTETNLRNMSRLISIVQNDNSIQQEKSGKLKIEWHKKFTLSFACLLLFLIGAPLGAIIRKGGIGMPVVIAVLFFVVYFIISSTGEKLAEQGAITPWVGLWLATAVLLPIALVILIAARNDAAVFKKEWYLSGWMKMKRMISSKVAHKEK